MVFEEYPAASCRTLVAEPFWSYFIGVAFVCTQANDHMRLEVLHSASHQFCKGLAEFERLRYFGRHVTT
jgi:hypothetical protein